MSAAHPAHRSVLLWLATLTCLLLMQTSRADEFANDLEAGVLQNDAWQIDKKGHCDVAVVADFKLQGEYAMRFDAGAHGRCEAVPKVYKSWLARYQNEPFGSERWYEFSTYFPTPWVANERNEIIAQWHGNADKLLGDTDSRGPPLAIRIYGDKFRVTSGYDADFISSKAWIARTPLWIGPVAAGQWLTWRILAKWSYKDDGVIKIWLNGKQIVDHAGPNTYNDLRGVYLKLGPYHSGVPRTMYLDNVSVGDQPLDKPGN